ncbi:MAG TPA: suppressor of fused domain protein, partial [Abditibacteriaceae bacterium]
MAHSEDEEMYGDDQPEVSPSGAEILRHQANDREFEFAAGDEELINAIGDHIETYIGPVETVFHEIISDLVHIDVHIVKATPERPFHVLVTSGMAALPMNAPETGLRFAELCVFLPASWPLDGEKWRDETF